MKLIILMKLSLCMVFHFQTNIFAGDLEDQKMTSSKIATQVRKFLSCELLYKEAKKKKTETSSH